MAYKKLVIAKSGCRDIAHELWNTLSIYAYGLSLGVPVVQHPTAGRGLLVRILNSVYARYIRKMYRTCIVDSWREITYLPLTKTIRGYPCDTLYFFGWIFRNPRGLETYRDDLLRIFAPSQKILDVVHQTLHGTENTIRIGVHVRQKPFAGFPEGDFLLSVTRVEESVSEYLKNAHIPSEKVSLVVVSDALLPQERFRGFTTRVVTGNTETNLWLLSKCSVVIGDNSMYSNLAAWFGNIPHIVITEEPIDWTYYSDTNTYFENKYATFAL